jgi:hypothetical protein
MIDFLTIIGIEKFNLCFKMDFKPSFNISFSSSDWILHQKRFSSNLIWDNMSEKQDLGFTLPQNTIIEWIFHIKSNSFLCECALIKFCAAFCWNPTQFLSYLDQELIFKIWNCFHEIEQLCIIRTFVILSSIISDHSFISNFFQNSNFSPL